MYFNIVIEEQITIYGHDYLLEITLKEWEYIFIEISFGYLQVYGLLKILDYLKDGDQEFGIIHILIHIQLLIFDLIIF